MAMLSPAIIQKVRHLRREGMTCRAVATTLKRRVSKSSVQRLAPGGRRGLRRCPTCKALVYRWPCLLCSPPEARFLRK
jgi:hypothetical protein